MNTFQTLLKVYWPYLVGLIILIVILSPIRDLLKSTFASLEDGLFGEGNVFGKSQEDTFEDRQKGTIEQIKVNSYTLGKDPSYYSSWAKTMYDAMQGTQYLNRFSSGQIAELRSLNSNELKQIVKEFGVKEKLAVDGLMSLVLPLAASVAGSMTGSLIDWMKSDLDGAEKEQMKSIFSKTGLW